MTSCEPQRSSAYSEDMRWRIVWQDQALGLASTTIAGNLNVDVSTVRRVVCLFSNTRDVRKKPYPAKKAFRKINEPVQYFINLVLDRPGIYLREIVNEVNTVLGTGSAVCKFPKGWDHTSNACYICFAKRRYSTPKVCI